MSQTHSGLSRRGFMGGVGAGGLALGVGLAGSTAAAETKPIDVSIVTTPVSDVEALPDAYYLLNVRLETGFVEEETPWLEDAARRRRQDRRDPRREGRGSAGHGGL